MRFPRLHQTAAVFAVLFTATALYGQDTRPSMAPKAPTSQPVPAKAYVLMTTSLGDILLELDGKKAPITVANFLSYTDKGFYDGTIFHRVMSTFMIQGGGLTPGMTKKPIDPTIKNEWRNGLKNKRGTISMARLGGQPDSASSQFFINVVNNGGLDRPQADGAAYAVFGHVVAGMDTVDKIRYVDIGIKKGRKDVPVVTVVIEKVRQVSDADAQKIIKAAKKPPTSRPG
jgi:cyclophilin family peptidyl-prolyl cis-trans isomerase